MTRIDQSDSYRRNSAVLKNFVLYSPDPPSARIEGLGTRLSQFHHPELVTMYYTSKDVLNSLQEVDLMPDHQWNRTTELPTLHWQLVEIVGTEVYDLAASKCEARHISAGCHWIPTSVTEQNCTDCQPICRNVYRTLNFMQCSFLVIATGMYP